jgi:hypothetical protein
MILKSLANCRYDGHRGYGQTLLHPVGSHEGESSLIKKTMLFSLFQFNVEFYLDLH